MTNDKGQVKEGGKNTRRNKLNITHYIVLRTLYFIKLAVNGVDMQYQEEARKLEVAGEYDVIVCGGGAAGFVSAIAAGREGMKTLIVERYGFLGGTATAALMVEFGSIYDGKDVMIGGITHEFLHRLEYQGEAELRDTNSHHMTFDPESMISVCQNMVLEAGVELLFHTIFVKTIMTNKRAIGIIIENKSGRQAIYGKVIIDATGDGDAAFSSGAKYSMGREGDKKCQPVTLEILLGNVDVIRAPKTVHDLIPQIKEANKKGEWPIPTERIFSYGRIKKPGAANELSSSFFFINGTNVLDVDGTSAKSLTRAEIETRKQVAPLLRFLQKYAPGFEKCYLDRTGAQVGIRETRRITGDYVLTRDDVLSARHFEDGVVPAANSIDVHEVTGKDFKHDYLKKGTHYEIPYRCFLPAGVEGVLVAGRCLSVDHHALGSARVMVVCMPMGEAVGVAAALSVKKNVTPRQVQAMEIKEILRKRGTVV